MPTLYKTVDLGRGFWGLRASWLEDLGRLIINYSTRSHGQDVLVLVGEGLGLSDYCVRMSGVTGSSKVRKLEPWFHKECQMSTPTF